MKQKYSLGMLAALGMGIGLSANNRGLDIMRHDRDFGRGYDFPPTSAGNGNHHEPRGLSYTDSGKPMSKRRARRLRGKGL